jgi:hypothetical protein
VKNAQLAGRVAALSCDIEHCSDFSSQNVDVRLPQTKEVDNSSKGGDFTLVEQRKRTPIPILAFERDVSMEMESLEMMFQKK